MTKKELKIKEMAVYEQSKGRSELASKRDYAATTILGLFVALGLFEDIIKASEYLYNEDESFYNNYAEYRRSLHVYEIIGE